MLLNKGGSKLGIHFFLNIAIMVIIEKGGRNI